MQRRLSLVSLLFLLLPISLAAQSNVGIEIDEVTDNRVSNSPFTGTMDMRVTLKGSGLDKAAAARITLKEAKDNKGTDIFNKTPLSDDFMPREYNSGMLQVQLKSPARGATSVKLKGTVELFVPSRDPSATIKIDKGLSKLDAPLAAKGLKNAKIEITPLSAKGYAEQMKKQKLDDKKIAELRERGKKEGIPEAEIELAIELAKAFEGIDGDPPENAIILTGKEADFDRIYRVEVLGADGKVIDIGNRSTSTRGDDVVMVLMPNEPAPSGAGLQFMLLTDKTKLSFPFELTVPLP